MDWATHCRINRRVEEREEWPVLAYEVGDLPSDLATKCDVQRGAVAGEQVIHRGIIVMAAIGPRVAIAGSGNAAPVEPRKDTISLPGGGHLHTCIRLEKLPIGLLLLRVEANGRIHTDALPHARTDRRDGYAHRRDVDADREMGAGRIDERAICASRPARLGERL